MRGSYGIVAEMTNEVGGGLPCFRAGLAHDDVQANAKCDLAPLSGSECRDRRDFFGDLAQRPAPGQILIDCAGSDLGRGLR